jgi:hypothetical protein
LPVFKITSPVDGKARWVADRGKLDHWFMYSKPKR